jgi:hypothetical protein
MDIGGFNAGLMILGTVMERSVDGFKSSDFMARNRNARLQQAVAALEAGVEQSYQTCPGNQRKPAAGKLTEEERRRRVCWRARPR